MPDQNLLRGSKSICDKVDFASIVLDVTEDDIEKIRPLLSLTGGVVPNVKMSVYKNRRGAHNRVFLWMYADKGTCRYETMFVTDFNYHPVTINEVDITVSAKEEEAKDVIEPVVIEEIGDDYEF